MLEITPEERELVRSILMPEPGTWLDKPGVQFITRLKKYISASPLIPARVKGFAMVFAERVGRDSGETTYLSYTNIAALIGSPRPREKTTISRRNAIANVADLEAFGLLETEVRRPLVLRDPSQPKNWRNRFRLRFPPHVVDLVDAQREHDEPQSQARASIEAEAAGREQPREDLDDVAAVDVPAPPTPTIFERLVQRQQDAQTVATTKRPEPAATTRVMVADSVAAPTELELAITAVRLRSMEKAIAEILKLYASAFSSLPHDFARTTSEILVREGHSFMRMLNGIEQSLRKPGPRGQRLGPHLVSFIVHVTGDPTTASKNGKRIVRAIEAAQAREIEALQLAARGRDPPLGGRA